MGMLMAGVTLFGMLGLALSIANMDPEEQTWGTADSDVQNDAKIQQDLKQAA